MNRLILSVLATLLVVAPALAGDHDEGLKDKLFLKSGRVIECDEAWIAGKDIVRCKKGKAMLLYSIDDVDLKKSFGEASGEFLKTTRDEESRAKETKRARVFAQEPPRKSGLGARVSYMTYSGDELTLYGVGVDIEADSAFSFGLNYTYLLSNHSSLEFSVDYINTDVQFEALGYSLNMGEIRQIPALLTLRFHPASGTAKPYLGAGVGYYFNSFDTNSYNAALVYGPGAEIDVENSFGFHVNGGVEFFLAENHSFNVDLKYLLNKTDGKVNVPGFTEEEVSMDALVVGIGLKYYY